MPRNGGGIYSLPELPFVPNTTISSAAVNSDFEDIADALTASVASDGQTPMTGALRLAAGTVGAPGATFSADTTVGWRLVGAGSGALTSTGVDVLVWTASTVTINVALTIADLTITNATVTTATVAHLTVNGTLSIPTGSIVAADMAANAVATVTIQDLAVTYAKMQDASASVLLGNPTGGAAAVQEITLGAGLAFSGSALVSTTGIVKLGTTTVGSPAAAITFVGLSNAYSSYIFDLYNVVPVTDNVQLVAEVSTDGGSTWIVTNYLDAIRVDFSNGTASIDTSTTAFPLSLVPNNGVSNAAGGGWSGRITLQHPSSGAASKLLAAQGGYLRTGGTIWALTSMSGIWNGALTAVTAFRLRFASGNVAAGAVVVQYGVP